MAAKYFAKKNKVQKLVGKILNSYWNDLYEYSIASNNQRIYYAEYISNVDRQNVWIYADIGNNIKIHGCENRRRQFKCLGNVKVGSVFLCAINFLNVGNVYGVNTAGTYITLITNAITVMLVAQWAETHCCDSWN